MSAVDGQLLYGHFLAWTVAETRNTCITLTDSDGGAPCHTWNDLINGLVKYNDRQRNNS
jgi:hypothetical protein